MGLPGTKEFAFGMRAMPSSVYEPPGIKLLRFMAAMRGDAA